MIEFRRSNEEFQYTSIVLSKGEIIPFEINCRISGTFNRHNLGLQMLNMLFKNIYSTEQQINQILSGISTHILMDVVYHFQIF
jgi:carbamoyl-phosphate synthase large subunit